MVNLAVHYNNMGVDALCRSGIMMDKTLVSSVNSIGSSSSRENDGPIMDRSIGSATSSISSSSSSSSRSDLDTSTSTSTSSNSSSSSSSSRGNEFNPNLRGSESNPNLLDSSIECRRKRRKATHTHTHSHKFEDIAREARARQQEQKEKEKEEFETGQRVDDALQHFQKALAIIVQHTESYYHGNALQYLPNDDDGYLRYEDDAMGKELLKSVNPKDTGIKLKGGVGCDSNEYIYWKAIQIGNNTNSLESSCFGSSNGNDDSNSNNENSNNNNKEQQQQQQQQQEENEPEDCVTEQHRSTTRQHRSEEQQQEQQRESYENLTVSIFHSMICIYNIALCYQYKGMTAQKQQLEQHKMKMMCRMAQMDGGAMPLFGMSTSKIDSSMNSIPSSSSTSTSSTTSSSSSSSSSTNQNQFESGFSCSEYPSRNNDATFYLNTAVDHYTQAYELMTRFRLEDIVQYTFLMAMMNNLASTYGSLNQPTRVDVCNKYLVQSLILVICSSERDGHLGQEVLSRTDDKNVLRKEEDRTTFESFLGNVMYLMMGDGTQSYHSGDTIAPAA